MFSYFVLDRWKRKGFMCYWIKKQTEPFCFNPSVTNSASRHESTWKSVMPFCFHTMWGAGWIVNWVFSLPALDYSIYIYYSLPVHWLPALDYSIYIYYSLPVHWLPALGYSIYINYSLPVHWLPALGYSIYIYYSLPVPWLPALDYSIYLL